MFVNKNKHFAKLLTQFSDNLTYALDLPDTENSLQVAVFLGVQERYPTGNYWDTVYNDFLDKWK